MAGRGRAVGRGRAHVGVADHLVHRAGGPVQTEHHWNDRIGLAVTRAVGTMWTAYAFAVLALVSLPAALAAHSALVLVSWTAQTFIQLVLLPVIIVGQRVASSAADARSEMTYKDTEAILAEIRRLADTKGGFSGISAPPDQIDI